jgi:toxin ParE1/3/4
LPYRLSNAADLDVDRILLETARRFGPQQRLQYALLIMAAMDLVGHVPERPGSRARDDLAPGVRSFHVERAARRQGAAAHVLFYIVEHKQADGGADVIILRVLHDRMDPARHIDLDI